MTHARHIETSLRTRRASHALAATFLFLLAGCAVHAPLHPLPENPGDTLTFARTAGDAAQGQWPEREWWSVFGDAQLTALIKEALTTSPDMDVALARIHAAEARAAGTRAPLIPTVETNVGAQRSLLSVNGFFPPPFGGSTLWQNKASLDLRWELDLWGRHRSALTGALHDTEAARLERDTAELTLTTAIARRYIEWQRLEEQLDIGRALLKQREGLLALTQKRVDAGLDSNVPLRTAEAAIPATRAEIAGLETQATVARLEIAALIGAGPDRSLEFARPALKAPGLSGTPTLLPADLLARRPDVMARRLRAEAASARADSAQADFYPNINLAAAVGFDSIHFDNWLEADSVFYNAGPALHLPLFGGGSRRATLKLRTADYDEAAAVYRQTLIGAVRDVAAAVTELRSIDVEDREQRAATRLQDESFQLARRRYDGGLGTYTEVLLAEAGLINQQRNVADMGARRLDANVRLVAALGGGIPAPPPAPPSP